MKNRFLLTLTILLIGFNNSLNAQEIIDKLAKDACSCIEKQEVKNSDVIRSCFEDILISNMKELKEHYEANTIEDLDVENIGILIVSKLVKDCTFILENYNSEFVGSDKEVTKQADLNCNDLKNGDFYYLTKRPDTGILDTTFVTISNTMFLERMNSGRTYSMLDIKWKENCEFDLIFKESNDPVKKNFSKPGDVYEYEILTNGVESFFLNLKWKGSTYQMELFKLE